MMVRRGDVYYADLAGSVGSEQGGLRPVVVIQNDKGNRFSPTLIVAPISSRLTKSADSHACDSAGGFFGEGVDRPAGTDPDD